MVLRSIYVLAVAICLAFAADPARAQGPSDAFIETVLADVGTVDALENEINAQVDLANGAKRRCDYAAWLDAQGRLLDLYQRMLASETRAAAVLEPLSAPKYKFNDQTPAGRARERKSYANFWIREAQRYIAGWSQRKFIPCDRTPRRAQLPGPSPASAPADRRVGQATLVPLPQETGVFKYSSFEVGGSFAFVTLPKQGYLGSFNPETGQETVGSFRTNRDLTMGGGSFNFEQGLGGGGPPGGGLSFFVYGAVQAMEGRNTSSGSFDPGPGNRTLFPGPEGGASGVSLGGFPLNAVTGINYRGEYSAAGGLAGFGTRFFVSPNVRVSIGGHAGYQNLDVEQSFAGAVPGFARTFSYETSTSVDTITFGLKSAIEWQAFPNVVLSVKGHAGGARLDGSGTDTFAFTGLPTSTAGLDADKTQFVGGASAGVQVTLAPLSSFTTVRVAPAASPVVVVGAAFGFERSASFPTVFRDGTNRSQLQFNGADAFWGKVSIELAY